MDPNKDRNRKVIVIAVLAVIIVGSLIYLLAVPGKEEPAVPSATQDQTTGSEAQQVQTGVQYEGFGDLSQHGFTEVQMSGIRYALFQYAPKATNFAIKVSTINDDPYNPSAGANTTFSRFDITIDKTTYNAVVEKYLDFNTIRVQLSSNGKVVYASPPIDISKMKPSNDDYTVGD